MDAYGPFTYSNGTMSYLGGALGGSSYSEANAINSSGTIVGYMQSGGVNDHAFSLANGTITDLDTLGDSNSSSFAQAINDSGTIAGTSDLAGNTAYHAFSYSGGAMTDLGTLGGLDSSAAGINDSGIIVGSSSLTTLVTLPNGNITNGVNAFSYDNGSMTDLGTLGGSISGANAINDFGAIVGYSNTTGNAATDAFIYSDGVMTDLNSLVDLPGITLEDAVGINDLGQIAVNGYSDASDNDYAYLLTPISEPSASCVPDGGATAIMLGSALAGVAMLRRRFASKQ